MKGTQSMAPGGEQSCRGGGGDGTTRIYTTRKTNQCRCHKCQTTALDRPNLPSARLVDINVADWIDDDDSCCCCSLGCLLPHGEAGVGWVRGYLVLSRFAILSQARAHGARRKRCWFRFWFRFQSLPQAPQSAFIICFTCPAHSPSRPGFLGCLPACRLTGIINHVL